MLRRRVPLRTVAELFGVEARELHRELENVSRETIEQKAEEASASVCLQFDSYGLLQVFEK